jgi:GT2 family glycosyltransferase
MIPIPIIAVLLTCHNRKYKTLQCLHALYRQQGLEVDYHIEVFLVDDASSDGTTDEIQNQFPAVNIISGDGNLYWNRGMHKAWQTAADTKDYGYYAWLNDDTFLYPTALQSLLTNIMPASIICGTTQEAISKEITYGGYKNNQTIKPNGQLQHCDFCNGNLVLIPREVYKKVGNLDPVFHHAVGDFDYSLRAKKLGFQLFIGPSFVGTCESHGAVPKWRDRTISVFKRVKFLYSASSGCYPPEFFVFEKRHNGFFMAIVHYFSTHLRAIFPQLWKLK